MRTRALALFLAALALLAAALPARAQILTVTGEYVVVELDQANNRIGVALPEAKPDVRQNWIYVKLETEIVKRHYQEGGWFKDETITPNGIWTAVGKGTKMKVHGGRGWDGTITAKKIWI